MDRQESSNSSSTYEREIVYIDKTPFNITRMGKHEKWRIAIGNRLVSPKTFKKQWMARVYIKSKPIQLTIAASVIISKMENE